MRVVFMGTPDAAVPSLRALAEAHEVAAVYTRRDKPRGRGRQVAPSPVKVVAEKLGLPIVQPKTLRGEAEPLREVAPDAIAVVAYGMILPPDVLESARLGSVNVHFSLLPRWRGAAPVERAILAGDERTGVTTMLMNEGLDTGPILYTEETEVAPDDTTGSLRDRLATIGAPLLVRTLADLDAGTVVPTSQPDEGVTIAPKIEAHEAELDPLVSALELERRVCAMSPSPGAFVWFRGKRLKVWRATVVPGSGEPGKIAERLDIQTADGRLRLLDVQPEGKRAMDADAFVRGYRPEVGETMARVG